MRGKTKDQLLNNSVKMRRQTAGLKKSVARYKAEEKMHKWSRELRERSKELKCVYGISRIVEKAGVLDETIQKIIDLIPSSWQYPGITCARIILEGREFKTHNFNRPVYKQSSDIRVNGKKAGSLEVCYMEKRPNSDEGPFLNAERYLLDAIAERLGKIIEHKQAEMELRDSHKKLRELFEHLQTIREAERKDIAYKIHDEFGQALTAIKLDIRWLSKRLPQGEKILLKKTCSMAEVVDSTIQNVQRMASELRPALLDDFGFSESILYHAEEFQKHSGIKCEVLSNPEKIILDKERATMIFRILQELLTNVARHANATRVRIRLAKIKGALLVNVRDNGKGIAEEKISDHGSFGLLSIQERIRFWGGTIKIKGLANKGTSIRARFPLTK